MEYLSMAIEKLEQQEDFETPLGSEDGSPNNYYLVSFVKTCDNSKNTLTELIINDNKSITPIQQFKLCNTDS